jgi:putative acetyltransferase
MLIRRETDADVAQVHAVVAAAFRQPESLAAPYEVRLLEALRAGPDWLPALSLVAEGPAGDVVGHVVCSRAWVGDAQVVGLGPLAVRPDEQGRGVGSALMHAVVGAAEALEIPVVALLGSTTYYARFGFRPVRRLGIEPPEPAWGDHFQARLLVPPSAAPRGPFRYAAAFTGIT